MLRSISRRMFVSGAALIAASQVTGINLWSRANAAGTVDLDSFLALSKTLLGQDPDRDMGSLVLTSFLDEGLADKLAALAGSPDAKDQTETANSVVAAWYTGLSPDGKSVTSFEDALVWPAMSYSKPWAMCGGEYGYWGDAPAAE